MPQVAGATNRVSDLVSSILASEPAKAPGAEQPAAVVDPGEVPVEEHVEDSQNTEVESEDNTADEAIVEEEATDENVEADAAQDEQAQEPQLYTITVDGKEEQVTLDEALAGYQRSKDYTRKTQEAAEIRKAADAEISLYREQRTQYEQILAVAKQRLDKAEPTDDELLNLQRTDPQAYLMEMAEKTKRREQREAVEAEQRRINEEKQKEYNTHLQAHLAKEAESLFKKMPAWRDKQKAEADMNSLRSYALSQGVSEQEFTATHDHRVVLAFHKARLYDELLAKKPVVQKKIQDAPRMAPAGARKPQKNQSQVERERASAKFNSSGRIEDAVPLLLKAR